MFNRLNKRTTGIILVLAGTTLWGVSGTVAQFLFQEKNYQADWLVVVRLLISGMILLALSGARQGKKKLFSVWSDKNGWLSIVLFGLVGMLGVQYTYFAAIEASNAATATLLQYLGPVFITLYLALRTKSWPGIRQIIAVILALAGTYLLVTAGTPSSLAISGTALFWGLASALALAFYTVQPLKLLKEHGTISVIGWGMVIGGIGMSFVAPPWEVHGEASISAVLAILFVILFGTLIAFFCYLESLKYLQPSETSLLACAEPLSAALLAVIWLNTPFGLAEWGGAVCIIITVILLSSAKEQNRQVPEANTGDGQPTKFSI
ncbi:DMT family transporter [Bacillus sp. V33-4]|uniref:DMT family transporter n=1 Tax=Bacillus sp. V33-4 TaxID=2054169 RepID=UPI000C78C6C0|nr:DMT family transporter [Bacillus sp. V33-4]PLR81938.1 EamA family transporter [Bacillus sp. V33-4]